MENTDSTTTNRVTITSEVDTSYERMQETTESSDKVKKVGCVERMRIRWPSSQSIYYF